MKNQIINTTGVSTVDFIQEKQGIYRAIVKVRAGFLTVVDDLGIEASWGKKQWNSGIQVLRGFKKGALQTVQYQPEGTNIWLTVFARKGKTVVLIDEEILRELTVGDINQLFIETNLYGQRQYSMVGAKHWGHMAYTANEVEEFAVAG